MLNVDPFCGANRVIGLEASVERSAGALLYYSASAEIGDHIVDFHEWSAVRSFS